VAQTAICTTFLQTTNPLKCPDKIAIITGSLSGGIIALIVICVAVFGGLAAFGGKKGYDIWLKNRNNMAAPQTSALYTDEGRTGTNPLHE